MKTAMSSNQKTACTVKHANRGFFDGKGKYSLYLAKIYQNEDDHGVASIKRDLKLMSNLIERIRLTETLFYSNKKGVYFDIWTMHLGDSFAYTRLLPEHAKEKQYAVECKFALASYIRFVEKQRSVDFIKAQEAIMKMQSNQAV